MKTFVFNLSPITLAANDDTTPTTEQRILEMYKQGHGRRTIMQSLDVGESLVRRLTKDVQVEQKPENSPFARAVKKAYPMAIGASGIKDYQLREILFQAYGSQWNTATGVYDGLYTDDHLYRVRKRIREIAEANGKTAAFPMDWFDTTQPAQSNYRIRQCAMDLGSRVQDAVDDYMQSCGVVLVPAEGTPMECEWLAHELEFKKQVAAARLHILKLAIPEVGSEPISVLMERAEEQANGLAGTPDDSMPKVEACKDYHPEPTGDNAFLDYVEGRGWLHPDYYAEVEEAIANLGY